ncbi:MAG: hypothetical protein ACYTKD_31760, partial [Planctomycetota bacterium]
WVWGALCAAGWLSAASNRGFLRGIARHGPRFLRLAVLVGLALWGLEALREVVASWIDRWGGRLTNEWVSLGASLGVMALHGLLVLLLLGASDVAKASLHAEGRRSAVRALGVGLRFLMRHPVAIGTVVVLGAALQALVLFAAGVSTDLTLGATLAGFWAPLVLGQVFVAFRIALRAGTLLALARMAAPETKPRDDPRKTRPRGADPIED